MTEETYKSRRAELIRDFYRLRSIHCLLSAKDRIRKISLLDFQQLGIPIEETKKLFGYNSKTFESCPITTTVRAEERINTED